VRVRADRPHRFCCKYRARRPAAISGPVVIHHGRLLGPAKYSVMTPSVVMRPILLEYSSANQSAPSGPAVIPLGLELAVGTVNSLMTPSVVMRPILLPYHSVNHKAPSGPVVMPSGLLAGVGTKREERA
jgi:hypothetical protein